MPCKIDVLVNITHSQVVVGRRGPGVNHWVLDDLETTVFMPIYMCVCLVETREICTLIAPIKMLETVRPLVPFPLIIVNYQATRLMQT